MNISEIFKQFPKLETERLILRQLDVDKDADILFETLYKDPDVSKYDYNKIHEVGTGGFSSSPTMYSTLQLWQQAFWNKRIIVWGIVLKSTGELIGTRFCEFYTIGTANLVCKLNKKYWRKGLMTEASKAIIDFLEFHDIRQIITTVNKEDIAGINLDKKLGFVECSYKDLYFTQDVGLGESISIQGLMHTMQNEDEIIFVRPKLNPIALKCIEEAGNAKKNGDLHNCSEQYSKSLHCQPDFIHAINGLAWAKLEMGDSNGAIQEFNKLLMLKPNKYTGLLGRAYAFSDIKQWSYAINDLVSYLKLLPHDSETHVMLGNYYYQSKRFKEAIEAYDEALKINPNYHEAKQYKQAVINYL